MPINGYFDTPFAEGGSLTPVPDGVQGDGSVSYEQGYGILYSTKVESGGYNFPRTQHNQILHDVTAAIQQMQQNSVPPFITTVMNGGTPFSYGQGVRVISGGVIYRSLVGSNTTTPPSSSWSIDGTAGIPESAQAAGTYNPQGADLGSIIVRSNSGSAMSDTLPGTSGALAAAWWAYITNADASGYDSVGVGAGGSISVGNRPTANAFIIAPGETWLVVSLGGGGYIAMRVGTATLHTPPPQGAAKNLRGAWTSNTAAAWTADSIVLYDANGNSRLITGFSQAIAAGATGIGGLSTGSVAANTWYAVYAAVNPASGTQGIFFDPSFTSPTNPAGYSYSALIGVIRTDGSTNILGFKQYGEDWQYVVGSNLAALPQSISGTSGNVSTPTWTAASISSQIPTAIASTGKFILATGVGIDAIAAPNNSYGTLGSTTNAPPMSSHNNATGNTGETFVCEFVLESTNVYYASTGTGSLAVMGFRINL